MGEKLVIGPINQGLTTARTAFDNDSFPTLINAYQWRGRVKRKRGTALLGRLKRAGISVTGLSLSGSSINLISALSLQSTSQIVRTSINIVGGSDGTTYTDPTGSGVLTAAGGTGTGGSINYSTGVLTITAGGSQSITGTFAYYPDLPVMGIEDLILDPTTLPGTLGFDTKYSYNISTVSPYDIYDVSYYKNPTAGTTLPGYTAKSTPTAVTWNGQDYQQFWTTSYQGALWATNGMTVPFNITNVGMQFKPILTVDNITGGPPAVVNLTITSHGLSVGDFLFINEVATTTGINFQTGYVTAIVNANKVTVEFPNATIATNGSGGIAQYLTNRSDTTKDCLRWYDGDPTNGSATNPVLNGHNGWVNFCPPLSMGSYSIGDLPAAKYYLVDAKLIVPFKDRLLFIGPVVQTSTGIPIYLQDTVIYSQNGTPYYTSSFTGAVDSTATVFNAILTPANQGSAPSSYWEDLTGYGGFISSGLDQPIVTASPNEDVLIMGLPGYQTRFVYTGNDISPFNFFLINAELSSTSTFSTINMDDGVITRGSRGYIKSNQTQTQRIDLAIPDQVFQANLTNNGTERICAQRDYINEWIYFTYPSNQLDSSIYEFPTQTLQYNYRDDSWAIFNETYTTYGTYRKQTGNTWATIGNQFSTWNSWTEAWDSGSSTALNPLVLAGNQQGFLMIRDEGAAEGTSLFIQSIVSGTITCPNHCLTTNDYIVISGVLGTAGAQLNGNIYSITSVTINTFRLEPNVPVTGTYLGGGLITRLYAPYIQTKQFPTAWSMGRKTRIGPQQYLFSGTSSAQITLLIFLSQDDSFPYNTGPIVPSDDVDNNSLVYSTILYTCPESTNLGLTPSNVNLQMPTAKTQRQIWHRMNTSLIGDTVQIGFTLSDSQMRDTTLNNQFAEIEFHSAILDVTPSQMLS